MSNFGNYNNPYGCTFNNDGWKRGYWDRNSYATEEEAHNAWRERRGYTTSGTSATSSTSGTNGGGSTNDSGSTASPSSAGTTDRGSLMSGHDYEIEERDRYYTDYDCSGPWYNQYDNDAANRQDEYYKQQAAASSAYIPGNPYSGTTPTSSGSNSNNHGTHVVQRGESLWSIAKRLLGVNASNAEIQAKVNELAANNGIRNPNRIYPGQKINY